MYNQIIKSVSVSYFKNKINHWLCVNNILTNNFVDRNLQFNNNLCFIF